MDNESNVKLGEINDFLERHTDLNGTQTVDTTFSMGKHDQ